MNTQEVIDSASVHLQSLQWHVFDVLNVSKPKSAQELVNLAKIISKLSPIIGNLIEFNTVEFLNTHPEFHTLGTWVRQDPGFPDAIFAGKVEPTPGFEIKAWFPLATEITARFKDSQKHFLNDQTHVCLLAWLPERIFYGRPRIVDVCVVSGKSVADARDKHYHNPPDYLVLEPEDTSERTSNLQQTNTNGYKFQGTTSEFAEAKRLVDSWGSDGRNYRTDSDCQERIRDLQSRFSYRLDTNFAKMDRIQHADIEAFKQRVLTRSISGKSIRGWYDAIRESPVMVLQALERLDDSPC